jgi:hypothetical protein
MEFFLGLLGAFITGGLLCACCQFFVSVFKLSPPPVLIGSIVIGALLTPIGVPALLEHFGQAGVYATFFDAGAAFTGTLLAGFTTAEWLPFIIIICVVVLQIPIGILTGMWYERLHPMEKSDSQPRPHDDQSPKPE